MKTFKSRFTKHMMKRGFALVEIIIRMGHWFKVSSSRILYEILVESICSFTANIIENTKRSFHIGPVCYFCQCIWQVLPVVKQMDEANFNFFIFFLNK